MASRKKRKRRDRARGGPETERRETGCGDSDEERRTYDFSRSPTREGEERTRGERAIRVLEREILMAIPIPSSPFFRKLSGSVAFALTWLGPVTKLMGSVDISGPVSVASLCQL